MYYPITLDKERTLRYDMRALDQIERRLNTNIASINFRGLKINEIATILWAGLSHEDKDLTIEGLFDIMCEKNIRYMDILDLLITAFEASIGGDEEDGEGSENPSQAADR